MQTHWGQNQIICLFLFTVFLQIVKNELLVGETYTGERKEDYKDQRTIFLDEDYMLPKGKQ